MTEQHTIVPVCAGNVLNNCIRDAELRCLEEEFSRIVDVRLWYQKWVKDDTVLLSPTVVIKFDRKLRYVYHDGRFAYELRGQTTVQYYDAVRARKLPAADDLLRTFLVDGAQ